MPIKSTFHKKLGKEEINPGQLSIEQAYFDLHVSLLAVGR
jgi:hypothetical protein